MQSGFPDTNTRQQLAVQSSRIGKTLTITAIVSQVKLLLELHHSNGTPQHLVPVLGIHNCGLCAPQADLLSLQSILGKRAGNSSTDETM